MTIKVLLLPLLTQPLLAFFLCISHSSQSFFHTLSTLLKIRSDPSMQIFWVSVTVSLSDTFLMFLPSTSLLYQLTASTTTGFTSVFICHILSISSSNVFVLVFLFDFPQCDVSIWFHSLQEEFNKSLTMMSGLFAAMSFISIDWPVLHNGDVVVFNVQHSLWLMPVPFVCNLDIMIFTNAPVEIGCSLIVPGDLLFWLIPYIQIQYGPLSLHVVNIFCICSPLAGHILLSGSFWCLLPGLYLLPVAPLFLLSDYLITICWWWLCLYEASLGSLDTGHAMLCFSTFIHSLIPSWTWTCVLGLDHFLSDLSSRFSNSGIVTSLVNLLAFLVIEMLALDLSRSCTWIALLCASDSDRALLFLFWMLFFPQSDPSLHLFSGCTAFTHLL